MSQRDAIGGLREGAPGWWGWEAVPALGVALIGVEAILGLRVGRRLTADIDLTPPVETKWV